MHTYLRVNSEEHSGTYFQETDLEWGLLNKIILCKWGQNHFERPGGYLHREPTLDGEAAVRSA